MAVPATSADVSVTDRIVLTMPTDADLRSVATLVLGGVGSRIDLAFEQTDDLQLAVLSALEATDAGEITFEVDADDDGLAVAIGPVRAGSGEDVALMRVLTRLVDEAGYERRGADEWLTLRMARGAQSAT